MTTMTRPDALATLTASGEPYELTTAMVHGHPCRVFANAPTSLRELFAENRSDETCFVYEDERYSFDDMYIAAAQIAHVMVTQYCISKGDRVAISMRNYPEWVQAFMAITSVGGIAVAMNALWLTEEMEYGLQHAGCRLLFADQERIDRVLPVYQKIGVQVIAVRAANTPPDIPDLGDLKGEEREMPASDVAADDDATILYTSGSTGHPKGAVSSHRNILSALLSWELDARASLLMQGITEPPAPPHQPATLLAVPLFHATGSHAVYLSSYRQQRKMVAMYKWDTAVAAELIEAEKISSVVAPAAMTGDLVNEAQRTNRDLSTLATVGGGGAPRAPEQVKGIAATFSNALPNTGWGMTETNAIGTGIGGQDYVDHPASSGRCSAVLDIAVFDEQGNPLAANQAGELRIRGASIIRGYWERPDANAEAFVDGWLCTGDVARIDEDGYLYIVDRLKDLVIRGGENIGCAEVEAALLEHQDIMEASVYAIADERLGEEVGATIYCTTRPDLDALRTFLAERIAKFKIPRYITMTEEALPRIASGKINKRLLREEAEQALEKS